MKQANGNEEAAMRRIDSEDDLFAGISAVIDRGRQQVARAVNTTMVHTYFAIGCYIVEYEQGGHGRAAYGQSVIVRLSGRLTEKYGRGWSAETLKKCRQFYSVYSIGSAVQTQSLTSGDRVRNADPIRQFRLSWNHYLVLMRIGDKEARSFYEVEAYNQQWSVRQLQREVSSSLYERLALSRNKEEAFRLATEGQSISKPSDIIKNPLVLEFVGLKPESSYSESDLEHAILSRLQDFLMECGKGFLFEARQKRFTFDEDNFYVDLVLYNRILQCYVLVDFKTDKLTHQDLGQMQMYVNYFDRYKRLDFEKPTIGILLCKEKNDALVELTLPTDSNIYAQQYALCLPDKEQLQRKLKEWFAEYENQIDNDNLEL